MYILIDKILEIKSASAPKDVFILQKNGKTRISTKDKEWLDSYEMMLTASKIPYKIWSGPIKGWQSGNMKDKIVYSFTKKSNQYEIYLEFKSQLEISSLLNIINKVKPLDAVMRFDNSPIKISIITANRWWAEEIIALAIARAQKVILNSSILKETKIEE